jgi:hypothetical protein
MQKDVAITRDLASQAAADQNSDLLRLAARAAEA